jgi:transposase
LRHEASIVGTSKFEAEAVGFPDDE